jgi:hypothetical protein
MRAVTEVRGGDYRDWTAVPATPEAGQAFRQIADELTAEYTARMRGF